MIDLLEDSIPLDLDHHGSNVLDNDQARAAMLKGEIIRCCRMNVGYCNSVLSTCLGRMFYVRMNGSVWTYKESNVSRQAHSSMDNFFRFWFGHGWEILPESLESKPFGT